MPIVRAPSGGSIFSDIGRVGSGLIAGALERRKEKEEKARQAALDANRFENTAIQRSIADSQIALRGAQQTEIEQKPDREMQIEIQAREDRRAAAQGIVDSMQLTPERSTALVEFFVENKRFPPGMDITPPIDRQAGQQLDQLEQLGFKADIKRRFLGMLAGDNVLELTPSAFVDMADSEIKRMVSANPNADFELIQSAVIDELERTLKAFDAKKKAAEGSRTMIGGQVVDFPSRVDDIINRSGR